MGGRILVTSFEPFGLIGKFVTGVNASQLVMEALMRGDGLGNDLNAGGYPGDEGRGLTDDNADQYIFASLPVDDRAAPLLQSILERENPSGVISMGEHMLANPSEIVIEPYAKLVMPSSLPDLGFLFRKHVKSDFVQSLGGKRSSQIGNYYCNDVYRTALQWSERTQGAPVAFVHVPVFGDVTVHTEQVRSVLDKMKDYVQSRIIITGEGAIEKQPSTVMKII